MKDLSERRDASVELTLDVYIYVLPDMQKTAAHLALAPRGARKGGRKPIFRKLANDHQTGSQITALNW